MISSCMSDPLGTVIKSTSPAVTIRYPAELRCWVAQAQCTLRLEIPFPWKIIQLWLRVALLWAPHYGHGQQTFIWFTNEHPLHTSGLMFSMQFKAKKKKKKTISSRYKIMAYSNTICTTLVEFLLIATLILRALRYQSTNKRRLLQ